MREERCQGCPAGRFRQVRIKTCIRRAFLVLLLAEPCQGDDQHLIADNLADAAAGSYPSSPAIPISRRITSG